MLRADIDPNAPLSDQAFIVAQTSQGFVQTLSTLRFNSVAIQWRLPAAVARRLGARRGSLAIQGSNLGLVTNYLGKDPLVNSAPSERLQDGGALARPREWRIRVGLSY